MVHLLDSEWCFKQQEVAHPSHEIVAIVALYEIAVGIADPEEVAIVISRVVDYLRRHLHTVPVDSGVARVHAGRAARAACMREHYMRPCSGREEFRDR